jgi:hypothetical protein
MKLKHGLLIMHRLKNLLSTKARQLGTSMEFKRS